MKKTILFLVILFISKLIYAQDDGSNVTVAVDDVNISAVDNVNIKTNTGKAYYNNKEIATKDDLKGSATIMIAASDATARSKAIADYVCSGTNDQVTILTAMNTLASTGGKIQLTEGTFNFSDRLIDDTPINNLTISGMGNATILKKIASVGDAVVLLRGNDVVVEDLQVDCNNLITEGVKIYNAGKVRGIVRNVKVVNVHSSSLGIWLQNDYSLVLNCFVSGGSRGIAAGANVKNCIIQGNMVVSATISIRANGTNILVANNLVTSTVQAVTGSEKLVNNYTITP